MTALQDVTFLDDEGRLIRVCPHIAKNDGTAVVRITVEADDKIHERILFDDEAWAAIVARVAEVRS